MPKRSIPKIRRRVGKKMKEIMFNSTILNTIISLIFIYLLYSLLATHLQEIISVKFGMRARILKKAIRRMLDDGTGEKILTNSFYEHPLIKYLGENKRHSKPSYLSAENFSKVLIDLLRGKEVQPGQSFSPFIEEALNSAKTKWDGKEINGSTLSYLQSIWVDSQGDVEKFKLKLEQWFDDTMERASGWYKKHVQLVLFFIGLLLAITFNIDSIAITQKLLNHPQLAQQLADNAQTQLKMYETVVDQCKDTNLCKNQPDSVVSNAMHGIAKSQELLSKYNSLMAVDIKNASELLGLGWKEDLPKNFLFGWLLTALAISLGAPFWFDLLNKVMKLRTSIQDSTAIQNKKSEKKVEVLLTNREG